MNIFFDFDGPIIDVSDRYYRAYLESLKDTDIESENILQKEDFWKLKQNRITDLEVGLMSGLTFKEAKSSADKRRLLSFKTEYIMLDKVFDDVQKTIKQLKENDISCYIVTLRRRSHLMLTVKQYKLDRLFNMNFVYCLADNYDLQNDVSEKYSQLVNAITEQGVNPQETWIVGDSETDIFAGRLAKYSKVIGISRGMRSKDQLKTLNPDHVIDDLSSLIGLLSVRV